LYCSLKMQFNAILASGNYERKPFQKSIIFSLTIADVVFQSCQYGVWCVSNVLFYKLHTLNFRNERGLDSNLCLWRKLCEQYH